MSDIASSLNALGIHAQIQLAGRWVTFAGGRGRVHVIEAIRGGRFYTWCDIAEERDLHAFSTAEEAIQDGLRRASKTGADALLPIRLENEDEVS